jgi:hypothetical protein
MATGLLFRSGLSIIDIYRIIDNSEENNAGFGVINRWAMDDNMSSNLTELNEMQLIYSVAQGRIACFYYKQTLISFLLLKIRYCFFLSHFPIMINIHLFKHFWSGDFVFS